LVGTRHPDAMTPDDRLEEIASIFALAVVRVRSGRIITSGSLSLAAEDSTATCLDERAEIVLSVSARPAG
jgi:hypothetical protein